MEKLGAYPIDVISLCESDGRIQPLRIRFFAEDTEEIRGNVQEIISCRRTGHLGMESVYFVCWVRIAHQRHLLELKYTTQSHRWDLVRRLPTG